MKVGLLGGSFNPAHYGHVYISKLALKKLGLKQIWWIPTKQNPFKNKESYQEFNQRFAQSVRINQNNRKIKVKFFPEIYSFDLINKLQKKFPQHEFFWLMGADNLPNFHRWKNFNKIIQKIKIVVFSRNNYLLTHHKTKSFQIYKNLCNNKKPLSLQNGEHNFALSQNIRGKKLPQIKIIRSRNCNISSTKIREYGA